MRISIAMTTYNGARYLNDQLDSFSVQTKLPDELVVCDDKSSDNTINILDDFKRTAPFDVKIICNEENIGYTKNFQKALSLCSGDLIFLSDQDDVWLSDKVEIMSSYFNENRDIYVLLADMIIVDRDLKSTGCTQLEKIRKTGLNDGSFVTGCGTALRREWVDFALPIPEFVIGHDLWLHRLAVILNMRDVIGKPLQYFRRHENNTSQWQGNIINRGENISEPFSCNLDPAIDGWGDELARLEAVKSRMIERGEFIRARRSQEEIEVIFKDIEFRICAHRDRISACLKSRLKRPPAVLNMYFRGQYRCFNGLKSLTKDLVRR